MRFPSRERHRGRCLLLWRGAEFFGSVAAGIRFRCKVLSTQQLPSMRRTLASASAIGCAALAGQSRAALAQEAPKYGFEGHKVNYGGAGDVKPSNRESTKRLVTHMSTVPDEWELFRIATRASIILDKLNEADAEIVKRPETLKIKALEGVDLTSMIDKACHRQSVIEWKAYAQCSQKKSAGVRAALTNPGAPRRRTRHRLCATANAGPRGLHRLVATLPARDREMLVQDDPEGFAEYDGGRSRPQRPEDGRGGRLELHAQGWARNFWWPESDPTDLTPGRRRCCQARRRPPRNYLGWHVLTRPTAARHRMIGQQAQGQGGAHLRGYPVTIAY